MQKVKNSIWVLSRLFAVGLFFTSGLDKISGYEQSLIMMREQGVSGYFLPWVILLEVAGSIAITAGFLTRFTCAFMAVFCLLSAFIFYPGYSHAHLMVWLKNTSCCAGFLLLLIHGAGNWSIDNWLTTRIKNNKRVAI
ncbi:DoxX family protein [Candidatus Pantoea deserta]|uniref:DoxX family protein n=1 Tax=Candidatus Pantoea deserta TaxID=1869313 RepID=A0A3N4NZE3_9GAMM|nr:DoxX family protein [Pantoea deserta]RPE01296.1 DoxX family protein [Pantoea deserta]